MLLVRLFGLLAVTCPLGFAATTVSLSPTSLSFGNQAVGVSSPSKALIVKNTGTSTLNVVSVAVSGDYAQTNNCTTGIAPAASCSINVVFSPATSGVRTGTLTIIDNAGTGTQTAALNGTGVTGIQFSPSSLSYGSVFVGSTSNKTFTVTNYDLTAATLSGFSATGDFSQTNNCGTILASLASCTVTAKFAPTAAGTRSGTLVLADSATNTPQTETLSGTGVTPVLTSITVSPATTSVSTGASTTFVATGHYSNGTSQNISSTAVWSSSAPSIATVSATGVAMGVSAGTVTISAASGAISGSAALTVNARSLTSITVSPTPATIAAGTTQQFTATGHYSDGTSADITSSASWSSSAPTFTSVTAGGLATGMAARAVTITAKSGSVSGTASLTVSNASLTSITLSNPTVTAPKGARVQIYATGLYSDGSSRDITATAVWSSSSTAVASVSGGLVSAAAAGSTTVTATSSSLASSTLVTVTAPTVTSLAVRPSSIRLAIQQVQQLSAVATYSDGSTVDASKFVSWSSLPTGVATLNSSGLLTAVAGGATTVTATIGTVKGSASATVASPALTSLAVSPATFQAHVYAQQAFTAIGTYADGSTSNLTQSVSWSSNATSVASVSNTAPTQGVVTPVSTASGASATITATAGALKGTATFTMGPASLTTLSISPASSTVAPMGAQQFTATAGYSDGTTLDVTSAAHWSVGNGSLASISNTSPVGFLTGKAAGSALVTATFGGLAANTSVTISSATLQSIAVTPASATVFLGSPVQYSAMASYSDGTSADVTRLATWSSADPTIATLINSPGQNGLAQPLKAGLTTVTATLGSTAGSTPITVSGTPLLSSIAITPANVPLAAGLTQQYTATATYSDGSTSNVTNSVTWSSSAASATINATGLAKAVSPGPAMISAALGAVTSSTGLTVTAPVLISLAVAPTAGSIAKGLTLQFVATGTYSDGSTADLTAASTWRSGNGAVASVSAGGLATGLTAGATTISAAQGSTTAIASLTVTAAALVSIAVSPTSVSIAKGNQQQFGAIGSYTDGSTADLSATATWSSSNPGAASVSATGLATGVALGSSTITAASGSKSGSGALTVTAPVLVSIAVTPAGVSLPAGKTQQYTATGTYSDATTSDISSTAVWASSSTAVASISSSGLATGLTAGSTTVSASSGSIAGSVTLNVTNAVLTSISVTPASPSIALGTNQQFTATGTFSDGSTQVLTGVTWASGTTAVASVSAAGLASTLATGSATVSASSGAVTGSANLTVTAATLVSIAVSPASPAVAAGVKQAFTALGTFTDNTTQDLTTTAVWASSSTGVATISNAAPDQGTATPVSQGATNITATVSGVTGTALLTVNPPALVSIAVTPAAPSIALGTSQAFLATGTYTDGSTAPLTASVTWASSSTTVATIGNAAPSQGLATTLTTGTATITATLNGIVGTAMLTVTPAVVTSISVTPANASAPAGTTQTFQATASYSDGTTQNVTDLAHWTAGDGTVATVTDTAPKGIATAKATGSVSVTASYNSVTGTAALNVTPATLTSLTVTPAGASATTGATQQYTATGKYSDGSTADITGSVTWSSSNAAVAGVSATGLVTTTGAGSATITAALGAVSSSAVLTVSSPRTLVSVSVTPANASLATGLTQQLTATANYSDGTTADVTSSSTWSAADTTVATVNTAGLLSGVRAGSTMITATLSAVSGTDSITVTPPVLVSIAVTAPTTTFIAQGSNLQFAATGNYSDGTTQPLSSTVTWGSADTSIVTVDSLGLATAAGAGSANVTATLGAVQGTALLTSVSGGFVTCSSRLTDLKVLVIAKDGLEADYPAIHQVLNYVGIPYTDFLISSNPGGLTAGLLANGCHGYYQGVILAVGGYIYTPLTQAEAGNLAAYEANFGVRQLNWFTDPTADFGLQSRSSTINAVPPTPVAATFTAAGAAAFPSINTATPLTINYATVYLAQPVAGANTTPYLTDAAGNALAAYYRQSDGREYLTLTFDSNQYLLHSLVLSYGLVNWVTKGLFLGEQHAALSAQEDDLFIDDAEWLPSTACGTPVDVTGAIYRINQPDFTTFLGWQNARAASAGTPGFRISHAFNGAGTVPGAYPGDTLTAEVQADQANFNFINHTFDHTNLNNVPYGTAFSELQKNISAASSLGLANFSVINMVTPDVSGLSNSAFLQAAFDLGVRYLVTDTSIAGYNNPSPNVGIINPFVSSLYMIPRHPVDLFFNVTAPGEWVAEYNCIYHTNYTYSEVLDIVSSTVTNYLLKGDLDPLMFHESNLRAYDGVHSLLSDLLDAVFTKYSSYLTLPVLSFKMDELGVRMTNRAAYNSSGVTATLNPLRKTLTVTASQPATIPITGLPGNGAENYGGQSIMHVSLTAGQSVTLPLP